jgi:hypothetical protein
MRRALGLAAALVALGAGPAGAATVSLERVHPCDDVPPDEVTPGCDTPPNGVVTVAAAPGEANRVTASATGEEGRSWTVRVADAGAPLRAGAGCAASAPGEVTCSGELAAVSLVVALGDGHDTLAVTTPTRTRADGGEGDDTLTTAGGFDTLDGGPGFDGLFAGAGDDLLLDRDGAVAGDDGFDGGPGADRVSYAGRRERVRVDLEHPASAGSGRERDVLSSVERAEGGRGRDLLLGDRRRNALAGGPGVDTLRCGGNIDLAEDPERSDRLARDCERAGDAGWLVLRTSWTSLRRMRARLRATCADTASAARCRGTIAVRPAGGRAGPRTRFAVPRGGARSVPVRLDAATLRAVFRGARVEVVVRLSLPRDARGRVRRSFGWTGRL